MATFFVLCMQDKTRTGSFAAVAYSEM